MSERINGDIPNVPVFTGDINEWIHRVSVWMEQNFRAHDEDIQNLYDNKVDTTAVVLLAGDQTVAGTKTFSSSPVVPAPTLDNHAATKAYADGS